MQVTTDVALPPVGQFVAGFIVTALIFPLIILGAGGNWRWVEGWLFALLRAELRGYAGYTTRVQYRLIPYVR